MSCLFLSGLDGALSILQKTAKLADSILMKTHPLQGELADAMARAYATMGENSTCCGFILFSVFIYLLNKLFK